MKDLEERSFPEIPGIKKERPGGFAPGFERAGRVSVCLHVGKTQVVLHGKPGALDSGAPLENKWRTVGWSIVGKATRAEGGFAVVFETFGDSPGRILGAQRRLNPKTNGAWAAFMRRGALKQSRMELGHRNLSLVSFIPFISHSVELGFFRVGCIL